MRSFAIATLLSAACAVNAANHTINVGLNGIKFTPSSLDVAVGDTLNFVFAGTHTVTQVANNSTCDALTGGIDSKQLKAGAAFSHTVTELGVKNFVCKVGDHCSDNKMRFVYNATTQVAAGVTSSSLLASSSSSAAGASASVGTSNSTGGSNNSTGSNGNGASQIGGSFVLGTTMALLVGLAL